MNTEYSFHDVGNDRCSPNRWVSAVKTTFRCEISFKPYINFHLCFPQHQIRQYIYTQASARKARTYSRAGNPSYWRRLGFFSFQSRRVHPLIFFARHFYKLEKWENPYRNGKNTVFSRFLMFLFFLGPYLLTLLCKSCVLRLFTAINDHVNGFWQVACFFFFFSLLLSLFRNPASFSHIEILYRFLFYIGMDAILCSNTETSH